MPSEEYCAMTRISTAELERRWKAVRRAMEVRNLDLLVMQSHDDVLGGYLRWFTDLKTINNFTSTVIFPREDDMTTISFGGLPPEKPSPPEWLARGIKNRFSMPCIPSVHYGNAMVTEKAVEAIKSYKHDKIGFVGMGFISAALYAAIISHFTSSTFEDATDMVDNIKAIKSEEEIERIREVCAIQDATFEYALTCVRPGRKDYEVCEDVRHKFMELGGEQTNIMGSSAPLGTPATNKPSFYFGNKVIEKGDQFALLIESSDSSGLWAEVERVICLGDITTELEEHFSLSMEALELSLNMLKPGAFPYDIWAANNEFMRNHGLREEGKSHAHGMGYDMGERPSIDQGETMKIQANMNLAVHPFAISDQAAGIICDNYIITEKGDNIRLHKTRQKLFKI